ncbi:MAG: hypothetical protein CSA22_01530 [Deltaproteobacteria bacterium]|nr:MAG: hypothetical protein CSA22_01530 [Deltaproteobacteria bacterium]
MKRIYLTLIATLIAGLPFSATADTGSLVSLLTNSIGVTEKQATGGAGAIFSLAKKRLAPEGFETVASAVPDMGTLLAAAPKLTGAMGAASGLAALSTKGENSSGLTSLLGSFNQLGMNQETLMKFVPVVLNYVNTSGGEGAMQLLEGVLK